VAETVEFEVRGLIFGHANAVEWLNAAGVDLFEHLDDFDVGPAVERTPQGANARGARGEQIRLRRADHSYSRSAAILLVIGVQDKKNVEGFLQNWVRLILELGHFEKHIEEIAGVTQIVVGVRVGQAQAVTVGEGRERRHLADQSIGLLTTRFSIEDFLGVGVKSRQCCNRAD